MMIIGLAIVFMLPSSIRYGRLQPTGPGSGKNWLQSVEAIFTLE